MTRALLDEARRHDAAMTEGPWEWDDCHDALTNNSGAVVLHAERVDASTDDPSVLVSDANAAGIAWLRTNLRALIDAHEHALSEVDALKSELEASECGHDSYAHLAARQNTELIRLRAAITALHADAEHWLTESDDRPNLRAAENRLRLILNGAP